MLPTANDLMSAICKACPDLTSSQLFDIAEAIDPIPQHIKDMSDEELLEELGITSEVIALSAHLGCDAQEAINLIESGDYLVLTDDEATEMATDAIQESVWAFQSWFLADFMPDGICAEDVDALRGDRCEGVNDAFIALIEAGSGDRFCCGMTRFAEAAIRADGRGHFMSSYDGEENEYEVSGEMYYIYRIN